MNRTQNEVCSNRGSSKNLITHHIPEVTKTLSRACNSRERRKPLSRGFRILKAYPQQGIVLAPKDMLLEFGDLIEIETAPVNPVAIIFQYGLPIDLLKGIVELILREIDLRIKVTK